jgi:hypothetical protein
VFFSTAQAKTGLTGFPNRSDRFRPVGCRERSLNKEVFAAPWLRLFRCGRVFEVFGVFEEFLDRIGLTGLPNRSDRFFPAFVRLSPTGAIRPVSETGLTGLCCQQPCNVCFRCVCVEAVVRVLFLGSVALQWLRELGKRSLRRRTSEFGFIGRILE